MHSFSCIQVVHYALSTLLFINSNIMNLIHLFKVLSVITTVVFSIVSTMDKYYLCLPFCVIYFTVIPVFLFMKKEKPKLIEYKKKIKQFLYTSQHKYFNARIRILSVFTNKRSIPKPTVPFYRIHLS